MLILFFTIVFIAELIVVGKIVSILKQASCTIKEINEQVLETKPVISNSLNAAKNGVTTVTKGVGSISTFIEGKKKDAFKIVVKGAVALVILLFLRKLPHKKVLTAVDILFAIGNLLKLA